MIAEVFDDYTVELLHAKKDGSQYAVLSVNMPETILAAELCSQKHLLLSQSGNPLV